MLGMFSTRYDVREKVVVITGAGSGIGAALATLLHGHGARVALLDVDGPAIETMAAGFGDRASARAVDVRDREAVAAALAAITGHFGRIDVVVANAGIAPPACTLRTIEPKEFDRVLDVNLTGVFNTVHPALDEVIRNHGHVVVVASAAAFAPGAGLAPYMISKAGVEQLGRALRIELAGTGATAGLAYFGFVQTPLARPLDDDPIGRRLDALMPWPLNQRISATQAAAVLLDGIRHRSASTTAPRAWAPYSLLRGALNVVIDNRAAASTTMRELIHAIEERTEARR